MDPLTAFGLVSNIFQVIDFSIKIFSKAWEINNSTSGALEENMSVEVVVKQMKTFSSKLITPGASNFIGEDQQLSVLASECHSLSQDIVNLLEKIKAKDPKSKIQSVWSAFKTKIYEKEKESFQQRLNQCRSQFELQLSFISSQDMKQKLLTIIEASKEDASKLEALREHVTQIRKGVNVSSFGPAAQSELQRLVQIQEEISVKIAQERVLKGLLVAFEEMHGRYESIEMASSETLRWIFNDKDSPKGQSLYGFENSDKLEELEELDELKESNEDDSEDYDSQIELSQRKEVSTEEDESKVIARRVLNHWLVKEEGILHISGKLGSGKSTLMKFLYEHPKTRTQLSRWAGDRNLVFENFFFWRAGSPKQKSLFGLYRALLHDVLKSYPDLIAHTLPSTWAKIVEKPWQVPVTFEISDNDVKMGFTSLISGKFFTEKHCFCFFIDGLDEFEPTTQIDHKDVVESLRRWTKASRGNLKLCVSSREENVFMNAFSEDPNIRLHDITRQDMITFVQNRLSHVQAHDSKEKLELFNDLVDKAKGIFMWVTLVVRSMREQVEGGASVRSLREELDYLPNELEALYEHILNSLSKKTRNMAYRIFEILNVSKEYDIELPSIAYSFLDDYIKDKDFAIKEEFSELDVGGLAFQKRIDRAVKLIRGCCKGLVEAHAQVDYTHRSVQEFLQKAKIKHDIENNLHDFNSIAAISMMGFASYRLDPNQRLGLLRNCLGMRAANCLDEPPYSYLTLMESFCDTFLSMEMTDKSEFMIGNDMICVNSPSTAPRAAIQLSSPLHILTYLGYHEYPIWRVINDPSITDTETKVMALAYCDLKGKSPTQGSVLDLLFARGLLSPETKTNCWAVLFDIPSYSRQPKLTVWQHYLLNICLSGPQYRLPTSLTEIFLRYKPNLDFSFKIRNDGRIIFNSFSFNHDQGNVILAHAGYRQASLSFGQDQGSFIINFLFSGENSSLELLSPRSWIEQSNMENKEKLFQMIDEQLKEKGCKEKYLVLGKMQKISTCLLFLLIGLVLGVWLPKVVSGIF